MTTSEEQSVTLSIGQLVEWRFSSSGYAQICEFRTKKVRLFYHTKHGRNRYALVRVTNIVPAQTLFEMTNPFDRGQLTKTKIYILEKTKRRPRSRQAEAA